MKQGISIISMAALSALCLTGCGKQQPAERQEKVIPVKVVSIGFSDHLRSQSYVGTVEEATAISLSFSGMGAVERVLVSEGERVRRGQLLAVLNSSTAQNAYDVARSTLHQAQDAYDRLKPLHEKGSITDVKWIEVETGLDKAKAMEAIAKKSLDDCKMYAPMSGVIAKRSVEEGANVAPGGAAAFKLVSIDEVDVKISVPENEISGIRMEQRAMVTASALGNREYSGAVHTKGVEGNPVSRTYDVRIRLKNAQQELMPGMVCKVFLQQHDDRQIIIPNRTVHLSHDNRQFVWLADGNAATRRFITVGSLSSFGVTVENGISAGDRLIVEGYQKVSEGMKITILN